MEPNPERLTNTFIADKTTGLTVMEWEVSSAGYAAVWATENTREAIFDAMERREVYATTGTRMTVRLFGGYDFTAKDARSRNPAMIGYASGVPMGGELDARSRGPRADLPCRGASSTPLGRTLTATRSSRAGLTQKEIHTNRSTTSPGLVTGCLGRMASCPRWADTVDVESATWTNTIGAPELIATSGRIPISIRHRPHSTTAACSRFRPRVGQPMTPPISGRSPCPAR
jgi:hypothetical protein